MGVVAEAEGVDGAVGGHGLRAEALVGHLIGSCLNLAAIMKKSGLVWSRESSIPRYEGVNAIILIVFTYKVLPPFGNDTANAHRLSK